MSRGGRWIGPAVAVAAAALLVWALLQSPPPRPAPAARATPAPGPATPAGPRIPPVQIAGSAIAAADAQGRPQWDIRAATVSVDSAAGLVTLAQVDGTYFEQGRPSVRFTAARGTFEIATRNVTLDGRVRAHAAASRRTLEADRVRWIPARRELEATGGVVLTQPGVVARADRLVA
ncbi:MAG: LPS export ABC transporter periplasmic protein LptC, partial [Armatimonadota bacterium]|nr:LPS export ABC transporter periplasmic protein LptC [Armatimonadota bacterium]